MAPAVEPDEAYFDATRLEVVSPGTLARAQVSSNSIGDVLTILLDGVQVSLQAVADPLSAVWIGSIEVPTRPGARTPASYLQHIRGAVQKSEDAHVNILFGAAGKTSLVEFPYGATHEGDITPDFVSPLTYPPGDRYKVTIVLIVERRNAESFVLVNIESVDVQAVSA